jgi:outer membrane protein assembly factor BamB
MKVVAKPKGNVMNVKRSALVVVFAGLSAIVAGQGSSADWPQWRGPNRDGSILSFTTPRVWPEQLNRKWKVDVGLGYATPLLVANRIYMFSRQGEKEVMAALDAESGKVLWQTGYPAEFTMAKAAARHGEGPKSTPAFADGKLYAIGMTGIVTAFEAATGKQLWQKPAPGIVPTWTSHAFSPLVDGGRVIFHVGGHNQGALTAFDANTGEVRWSWKGDGPGYGSPIIATLGGTRQIVTMTQQKFIGIDAATGVLLWERPFTTNYDQNANTPILFGQTVIFSGHQIPIAALSVTKKNNQWSTEKLWENADITLYMSDAVLLGDTVVGFSQRNSGQFFSLDARTGKTLWASEGRQATNAAFARTGDLWFALKDDGELIVAPKGATTFEPLRRYTVADSATWAQPVISGNRIFVKDVSTLALWTIN